MLTIAKRVRLTPAGASLNGVRIRTGQTDTNGSLLTSIYREQVGDYPKFFKMDPLCKLGFLASEILLRDEPERFVPRHDRAVVLFNRSGSFASDSLYQHTIADAANYYPSPAVFVYTLPNIVTGEIAIRNKYYGETSFYVLDGAPAGRIAAIVSDLFSDPEVRSALCGWVEYPDDAHFDAALFLVERDGDSGTVWNEETITLLMNE